MSSLRNSLHRRNHKERSQLAQRARLGILEKHKDYVLRARDYHSKQDRITRLRQKAAERNKDEFYFGMTRQKTEKGVHVQERGNVALPVDIVKVLKTQDENYMRTMRTAGLKKIDKLKGQLSALADLVKANVLEEEDDEDKLDEEELQILREAGIIAGPSSVVRKRRKSTSSRAKHIVFAESDDQARQYAITPRQKPMNKGIKSNVDADSETEDMGWKAPEEHRRKKRKEKANVLNGQDDSGTLEEERREQALKHRSQLLKELSARLQRDKQLRYAERELEMQKLLMGKGASRKLSGIEKLEEEGDNEESEEEDKKRPEKVDEKTWRPRVYKWRVERKR